MSNTLVGQVYEHIIDNVITSVRVDFEESGVSEETLQELRRRWQGRLTGMKIASFPWDPKLDPPAPAPEPALASQHGPQHAASPVAQMASSTYTSATLSPQTSAQTLSLPSGMQQHNNGTHIKAEPGMSQPNGMIKQEPGLGAQSVAAHPAYNRQMAAQRAAEHMQNQYGPRAAASINALQSVLPNGLPTQPAQGQQVYQGQQGQQMPQAPGPDQAPPQNHPQYSQGMASTLQQQQQQQQQQQALRQQQQAGNPSSGLPGDQVDGPSGGYEGVLMQRDANGNPVEMGRVDIDNLLHAQIAARAKQMEGGGLMLPLKEATRHRSRATKGARDGGAYQIDGPDDDVKEEDDEDAINSDLDDPDDNRDDDDDDDDVNQAMMLCMYDKVQRVKNKWKCVLKDGVLTVNQREYVFHKATGEYEW